MGIGGVTSANNMSVMQMTKTALTDTKSKNIQNEITDARQQMQKVSSKDELSVDEKAKERKELQKEISSLNTELKQHQEELLRSQKREIMLARLREDQGLTKEEKTEDSVQPEKASSDQTDEKKLPADEQRAVNPGTVITKSTDGVVILKGEANPDAAPSANTEKQASVEASDQTAAEEQPKSEDKTVNADTDISHKTMHAIVSADSSIRQADRLGTIIAKTNDGIAILKGEMTQDERRGVNTERKQSELAEMERREQRMTAFRSSILGAAGDTMKSAAEADVVGIKDNAQFHTDNRAFSSALNTSQEEQAGQRFYVSIA